MQSIVRVQPRVPPQDEGWPDAVHVAAAGGGSDDEQRFSAPVRVHVTHSVTATPAAAGGEDGDCGRFGEVLRRIAYSNEADTASFQQQIPILKQGWLHKLARFGRDMRRCVLEYHASAFERFTPRAAAMCSPSLFAWSTRNAHCSYFVIAPLDAALLRPALYTGSCTAANPTYAVFYYVDQPQDVRAATPCGVITMDTSSAVEALIGSGRREHCVRLSNAQQHIKRKLHSKKRT
jgi:hypothetical protein